jgi:predicted amidohydrolase YtcJ
MTRFRKLGLVRSGEGHRPRLDVSAPAAAGLSCPAMQSSDRPADLVVAGAVVRTMDPASPLAEAVAVRDGWILAVGSDREIRGTVGPRTEVLELPGRLVLPGFQDAHVHPGWGGLGRMRCDLSALGTREEYRDAVAAYAASNPEAEWILGAGWAMPAFPRGTPRREDLDDVVPDRPVFLPNRDGHGGWVNTKALEVAGIDPATPDPPDGRIQRDADGSPTGTLHEGAMELVERLIPETTPDEWDAAILEAQRYLHSLGITAWQDAWVEEPMLKAYRRLDDRGLLTARVIASLWWDRHRDEDQVEELLEWRRWGTAGRVRANTVKVMLDGVCETYTASMLEPYLDGEGKPSGTQGLRFVDPEALPRYVTRLDREGFQVHFHAIGDRAVRDALDAVEAARRANGSADHRHHIAHIQVVHPNDVPRFGSLDVVANAQALWACHEPQMDDLTSPFLGDERAGHQYPFGSIRRAGGRLAMGSDWSVSTPDPFAQMEVAVERVAPEHRGNRPFLPDERIDLSTALEAFTRGSAYVNHLEEETGTLAPGMAADLVVVDRDIAAPDAGPIAEARALLTMVGGRVVHEDRGLSGL